MRPRLSFRQTSIPELWDAEDGSMKSLDAVREGDRVHLRITLHPRQSAIVVFDPAAPPAVPVDGGAASPALVTEKRIELSDSAWRFQTDVGAIGNVTLGDWAQWPGLKAFSGTGWYEASFNVPSDFLEGALEVVLDCGDALRWKGCAPGSVPVGNGRCAPGSDPPDYYFLRKSNRKGKIAGRRPFSDARNEQ
jgi:hypothetical protein